MAMFFLTSVCAFGAGSDKSEVKGMIIGRNGESLLVDSGGGKVTVLLTDDTTTKDNTGLFGLDREHLSSVVLIPGLKVDVNGVSNEQGQIVAKTITVDGDDLEAAEMMQAGLHPTAKQVEANVKAISTNQKNISANQQEIATNQEHLASHDEDIEMNMKDIAAHEQKITKNMRAIEENTNRFTALTDYDVKGEATVKFNAGSSKISTEDQEEIKKVAQIATGLKGYIIEVMGYADATGSAGRLA